MAAILGKKIKMTQIFTESGQVEPVTIIEAGPCVVTQIKTVETDGYEAVQLGFDEIRPVRVKKATEGHCKKAKSKTMRYFREFSKFNEEVALGDEIKADRFVPGDLVKLVGVSKGRGFQGAMKRHGFSGANKTHGQSDRWRAPGSLGQSSYPSRVFKGLKMAGRMGNDRVTIKSTSVLKVDAEKNLIFIKGSVPGATGSLVEITKLS